MGFDLNRLPTTPDRRTQAITTALALADSPEGRSLALDLAEGPEGRSLSRSLAEGPEGRSLALDLAEGPEGRSLARSLAEGPEGGPGPEGQIAAALLMMAEAVVVGFLFGGLLAGVAAVEVLYVAGAATWDRDEPREAESLAEAVEASGLEFSADLDPEVVLAVRGLLEQLVGLLTEQILDGRFAGDTMVEQRINRDRDSLRWELFENAGGLDGKVIAPIAQRAIATLIPVLDEGPGKDLLRSIAGVPDPNPQSLAAAERALDKGQQVADAIPANSEHLPAGTTPVTLVGRALRWAEPALTPTVEIGAPASAVTTVLVALGVSGPISVTLGAVIGLLYYYRPRRS